MIPKLIKTQRAFSLLRRHFASQITPVSSKVPAAADPTLPSDYTAEGYLNYFESGVSIVDLPTLKDNIRSSNFEFFLAIPNFLKVADALQKYTTSLPDGLEKDGAVQFKKQLYALYQARGRSVSEHDSYTREIEAYEVPQLLQSSERHLDKIRQQIIAEREHAKSKLKGAIIKNTNNYPKLQKLGVALANLSASLGIFLYYPYITAIVGHGVPSVVAALTALNGMLYIMERNNTVDELRFVKDDNGNQVAQISICQSMVKRNLRVVVPLSAIQILSIEQDRPAKLQITMSAKDLHEQIGSSHLEQSRILDLVEQGVTTGLSMKREGLSHQKQATKELEQKIQFILSIPKESTIDTAMIGLLSHPSLAGDNEFVSLFEKRVSSLTLQAQVLAKPIEGAKVSKLLDHYGEAYLDKIDDQHLLRLYSSQ